MQALYGALEAAVPRALQRRERPRRGYDPAVDDSHRCPICGADGLRALSRYPRYVCRACAARTRDDGGRPVGFFNEGLYGVVGVYLDTRDPYRETRCWIDGRACRASDARFGGIVIQLEGNG